MFGCSKVATKTHYEAVSSSLSALRRNSLGWGHRRLRATRPEHQVPLDRPQIHAAREHRLLQHLLASRDTGDNQNRCGNRGVFRSQFENRGHGSTFLGFLALPAFAFQRGVAVHRARAAVLFQAVVAASRLLILNRHGSRVREVAWERAGVEALGGLLFLIRR